MLEFRQHTGEDLQAQILFVPQPIRAPLDEPDLVVEALHEPQRHFVLRMAEGGNPLPMTLDQLGKLFIRLEPLPLQGRLPIGKEMPCPPFLVITPQLPKRLFAQIGGMEALVDRPQFLQGLTSLKRQVLTAGEQGVLLAFDELAVLALEPGVFRLAHFVQGLAQVAQHVEFVEQAGRLRRMGRLEGGGAKGLPHVHNRQSDFVALLGSQLLVEQIHTGLRAIFAPEPEHPSALQVTHHDPVPVPLLDREFIDPNHSRTGQPGSPQLFPHVRLLQLLDRVPVQPQFPGHRLNRGSPTAPAHVPGKAFGVQGIVGQPRQLLLFHLATTLAAHPPDLHLQVDPCVPTGEVPYPARLVIVERAVNAPTGATGGFFPRRWSRKIRTLGAPKTPQTVALGRKPGKRYVSARRRSFRIRGSCQIFSRAKSPQSLVQSHFRVLSDTILPTQIREEPLYLSVAYREAGRYEEALVPGKRFLSLNPNSVPAHFNLAVIYSELGREEEARAVVAEWQRLAPNISVEGFRQ